MITAVEVPLSIISLLITKGPDFYNPISQRRRAAARLIKPFLFRIGIAQSS